MLTPRDPEYDDPDELEDYFGEIYDPRDLEVTEEGRERLRNLLRMIYEDECRLRIRLMTVHYYDSRHSQDIGSEWDFRVIANGEEHEFHQNLRHGRTAVPDMIVYDEIIGTCGTNIFADIIVEVTEIDRGGEDFGSGRERLEELRCPTTRLARVFVDVEEKDARARLEFTFGVEATCY